MTDVPAVPQETMASLAPLFEPTSLMRMGVMNPKNETTRTANTLPMA